MSNDDAETKIKEQKTISLEDIREKSKGVFIDIPDWEPDKTIKVRVRAIDITPIMMQTGAIPDELSIEVATMFESEEEVNKKIAPKAKEDPKVKMEKLMPTLDAVAEAALAEPTFKEIQEIYPLTLQQKLAIFTHVMGGLEKLKPFRA